MLQSHVSFFLKKTCISLALVDSAEAVNGPPPKPPKEYQNTMFHTRATLIVVPKHLSGQWPDEINKFLGSTKNVLVLKDLNSVNSLKVSDVLKADIVVTSFAVIANDKYLERLGKCRTTRYMVPWMPAGSHKMSYSCVIHSPLEWKKSFGAAFIWRRPSVCFGVR